MKYIIDLLKSKKDLSFHQAQDILLQILKGYYEEDDIYEFLTAYEKKPYHHTELLGFITAMKKVATSIQPSLTGPIIDVCGTGGSNKQRFNISTCVAFVLAAGDIYVAKHGNYGSKRPNGSFNFLEELHVPFNFNKDELIKLLTQSHCCFIFARMFHPGMRYVANARKKYNKRTVFNYLGPFANPVNVDYQLVGLANESHLDVLIELVKAQHKKHVMFCIGGDQRDEISLSGVTKIVSVKDNKVNVSMFDFKEEIEDISSNYPCGDSRENAKLFVDIFINQKWDHPLIKHIAINAAAAMHCVGKVNSLIEGYQLALELFKTEKVTNAITRYKSVAADIELVKLNSKLSSK